MAFYMDEEVWKCPKHPSKRRRSGICPICLRDRLVTLCADCGNVRPCACCAAAATTSSSSSSSSSFSLISSSGDTSKSAAGLGAVYRVSNLIDSEPSFRRSRSAAIPFLRSRFGSVRESTDSKPAIASPKSGSSFWSVFRTSKSKKMEEQRESEELKRNIIGVDDDYERRMMMRSRSASVQVSSNSGYGRAGLSSAVAKGRGWHFPSPIKAFRQSKISKVVQQRSPLYRG